MFKIAFFLFGFFVFASDLGFSRIIHRDKYQNAIYFGVHYGRGRYGLEPHMIKYHFYSDLDMKFGTFFLFEILELGFKISKFNDGMGFSILASRQSINLYFSEDFKIQSISCLYVSREFPYDEMRNGPELVWYVGEGKVRSSYNFFKGMRHGTQILYRPDGMLDLSCEFSLGSLVLGPKELCERIWEQ